MEELLIQNTFRSFSLENYYFTEQSIIVAAVNYLKSLNKKCEFLGFDKKKFAIISVDGFKYELSYKNNLIGLTSFDSISVKKVDGSIAFEEESELSKLISEHLDESYA